MTGSGVRCVGAWLAAAVIAAVPALAHAQQEAPRYRSWTAGPAGGSQDMVTQLRALVQEAERANAADPRFLTDLEALADAYDESAPVELLHDDFRDGDYTEGVAWTVTRGRWWVEPAVGLRSLVAAPAASPAPTTQQQPYRRPTGEDLAAAVLGNLLGQVTGPQQQQSQQTQQTTTQTGQAAGADATPAEIQVASAIPNAFSARFEITSRARAGEFRAGVYQRSLRDGWGYQIAYAPGAAQGLRLMAVSRGQATVIGTHDGVLNLEDGRLHVIDWSRSLAGETAVGVDGKELIRVTDARLRDPFEGLGIANLGGDFALRDVSVKRGR